MRVLSLEETSNALDWNALINALRDMFIKGCDIPLRHHHDMVVSGESNATMLLMPAWVSGEYIGVKCANIASL